MWTATRGTNERLVWSTAAVVILSIADGFVINSCSSFSSSFQLQRGETSIPLAAYSSNAEISSGGVAYQDVINGMDELFPPKGLDQRIALSRKDGYWPFISSGDEPPQQFVYGEFEVDFLARVLDRAVVELSASHHDDEITFCDLGSGTGRLVLATAALYPSWKLCRGIELLQGIYDQAVVHLESCRFSHSQKEMAIPESDPPSPPASSTMDQFSSSPPPQDGAQMEYLKQFQRYSAAATSSSPSDDWLNQQLATLEDGKKNDGLILPNTTLSSLKEENDEDRSTEASVPTEDANNGACGEYRLRIRNNDALPMAPIEMTCGSFDDPYCFYGDSNIVFCFSSAMPSQIMIQLARSVGRQCVPGTIVLTTEYQLPLGGAILDETDTTIGQYKFEMIETMTGPCNAVGGESLVYIHRVVESMGTGTPLEKEITDVSKIAYRAIRAVEASQPAATQNFLRNVYNQMTFLGLPESWRPKLCSNGTEEEVIR